MPFYKKLFKEEIKLELFSFGSNKRPSSYVIWQKGHQLSLIIKHIPCSHFHFGPQVNMILTGFVEVVSFTFF